MATVTLSPVVAEILNRATITENQLVLPSGQLDRKTYLEVNKVLELAGGVWNKKVKAHVFTSDPRERLGLALETGVANFDTSVAAPHIKAKAKKKDLQAFYTPSALAARLVEMADVSGKTVLEPSAGEGAIATECVAAGCKSLLCVEMDEDAVTVLKSKGFNALETDFLTLEPTQKFDRVVMNPPFTKNQDIKHVAHALKFLAPNGVLVAIMSPNTSRPKFKALIDGLDYDIEEVDSGTFKESGTSISTIILRVFNRD